MEEEDDEKDFTLGRPDSLRFRITPFKNGRLDGMREVREMVDSIIWLQSERWRKKDILAEIDTMIAREEQK